MWPVSKKEHWSCESVQMASPLNFPKFQTQKEFWQSDNQKYASGGRGLQGLRIIAICIYLFISDNMVSFVCRANIALCWCFCYCHFGLYCQAPQLHRESIFKVCSAKCVHFCAKLTFVNLTLPSFWHLSHSAAKPGHHNQQVNLLSKLHFVLWRSLQLRVNPPES